MVLAVRSTPKGCEALALKMAFASSVSRDHLPPELSSFTSDGPLDLWVGDRVIATDAGCGKRGFLTCLELPSPMTYASRSPQGAASPRVTAPLTFGHCEQIATRCEP